MTILFYIILALIVLVIGGMAVSDAINGNYRDAAFRELFVPSLLLIGFFFMVEFGVFSMIAFLTQKEHVIEERAAKVIRERLTPRGYEVYYEDLGGVGRVILLTDYNDVDALKNKTASLYNQRIEMVRNFGGNGIKETYAIK
jgi:hypothetical protein